MSRSSSWRRHRLRGVRAGLVVDLLAHHGALEIVHAEVQRELRQRRRDHDPVRLDVLEVVEEEPADGEVLQVVDARRRRAGAPELRAELVVVGMVRERDVGEESARLVLQVAQHAEMVDAVLDRLDVAVEHRAVGADAELVRDAVDVDPLAAGELLLGDRRAHAGAEHLGAAAGHRVEPRLAQRDEHVAHGHLLDARDVRDLDRGERLDVHLRMPRLEAAEHLAVVGEPRLHVEATDDVELARQRAASPTPPRPTPDPSCSGTRRPPWGGARTSRRRTSAAGCRRWSD